MLQALALLVLAGYAKAPADLPDTVAGKRMADLISAFNTRDNDKISEMVVRNFAKSAFIGTTKEEWIAQILQASNNLAPIALDKVLKSSDQLLVIKLKSQSVEPTALRIDLEPTEPYGIVGARIGSPEELGTAKLTRKFANWMELSDLAKDVQNTYKLPGVVVAYQKLGGKLSTGEAGVRNTATGVQLSPDDNLLVGAIGQTMTATLIAKLVEIHKLGWGQTLAQMLPDLPMRDEYKSVTLGQLLTHDNPIPQDSILSQADAERIVGEISSPQKARWAYAKEVLNREPTLPGAANKRQANTDYVLAGIIAEHQIRQSYEWLMERYVFQPMKLSSVLIAPVGADGQVGSAGHVMSHVAGDFGFIPFEYQNPRGDWVFAPAGAGVSASVQDLVKFAMFHLRGLTGDAEVLTEESYKFLHTVPASGQTDRLANGWRIDPNLEGQPCQWVAGTDGSFNAELAIWPKAKLVVAAMMNSGALRQPSPVREAILAVRDRLNP